MDVSKLFEPIRRLSKDETIALYKRHMMAQYERAETAEAEVRRLTEGLRQLLDCKGSFNGTVSDRGGAPAVCTKCEAEARALLAAAARLQGRREPPPERSP